MTELFQQGHAIGIPEVQRSNKEQTVWSGRSGQNWGFLFRTIDLTIGEPKVSEEEAGAQCVVTTDDHLLAMSHPSPQKNGGNNVPPPKQIRFVSTDGQPQTKRRRVNAA
ncbi:hypothetical protein APSETT445_007460 [Aspergillus pseudonomiae]